MTSWIKRTLVVVLAGVTLGGLTACGTRGGDGDRWQMSAEDTARKREKVIERVSSKLELNAEQRQRLNVLADTLQRQRAAMVGTTTDPRAEMRALVAGEKFDRARAQALVGEKTAAVTAGSPQVIAALADFYDSLNPAQQQKVREFMQRRHGWRG